MPIITVSSFGLACLQVFTKMTIFPLPINSYFIFHLSMQCHLSYSCVVSTDGMIPVNHVASFPKSNLYTFLSLGMISCGFAFTSSCRHSLMSSLVQQCFNASEIFKRPGKIEGLFLHHQVLLNAASQKSQFMDSSNLEKPKLVEVYSKNPITFCKVMSSILS